MVIFIGGLWFIWAREWNEVFISAHGQPIRASVSVGRGTSSMDGKSSLEGLVWFGCLDVSWCRPKPQNTITSRFSVRIENISTNNYQVILEWFLSLSNFQATDLRSLMLAMEIYFLISPYKPGSGFPSLQITLYSVKSVSSGHSNDFKKTLVTKKFHLHPRKQSAEFPSFPSCPRRIGALFSSTFLLPPSSGHPLRQSNQSGNISLFTYGWLYLTSN